MVTRKNMIALMLALTLAGAATAQEVPAEQRLSEEVQLALVRLIESGAFAGQNSEQIALTLDEPARRITNLGLLVDSATADKAKDGLRVLGVTPRSTAQRMGIKSGDRIVAINGTSLAGLGADSAGRAQAATTMRTLIDALPDGAKLEFALQRDDKPLTLAGELKSITLPPIHLKVGSDELLADTRIKSRRAQEEAAGGCGRVTDYDVAPRQQDLYGVRLLNIDGTSAGPASANRFRLSAGTHELRIAERIDSKVFRRQLAVRPMDDPAVKTLTVVVKPNTTYYLAAKFHEDKANSRVRGEYWEPVVWKEVPDDCG